MAEEILSYALLSLTDVKEDWRLTSVDATRDNVVTRCINEATDAIESFLNGRRLMSTAHTEYYDGTGRADLLLAHWPVTTFTSLHIDGNRGFSSSYLIAAGNYVVYGEDGIVRIVGEAGMMGAFPAGNLNIKCVYTAGYTSSTIPRWLKTAALETARNRWTRTYDQERAGVSSVSLGAGGGSTSYVVEEDIIPKAVKAELARHRVPGRRTHCTTTTPTAI